MKILITGSSGFVGTHLTKRLSKKFEIVRYDLVNGQDILNERLLSKKMRGVDLVIHLAALISASESWQKPKEYFKNNILGTETVARIAIGCGVKKIIFFSSAAVKANPKTPYAVSKIAAEKILDLYKDKIVSIIIRPENIYGPGQKKAYGYVIHNFIKAAKNNEEINVYGNGRQSRDFIYIDDVVSSVVNLISKEIKSGSVISLGTGNKTTVNRLANKVIKIVGKNVGVKHLPKRIEPRSSVAEKASMIALGIDYLDFTTLDIGIKKLLKNDK